MNENTTNTSRLDLQAPQLSEATIKKLIDVGCADLGAGDLVAGINGLVAMCCSLAAIAPPGSGTSRRLSNSGTEILPAGMNVLVGGSHSQAICHDLVIPPVQQAQNRYGIVIWDQALKSQRTPPPSQAFKTEPHGLYPFATQKGAAELVHSGYQGLREIPDALLEVSRPLHAGAGLLRGQFFLQGRDPKAQSDLFPFVHSGKAFSFIPLSSGEDVERMAAVVGKIRDGFTVTLKYPMAIRGQVMATAAPDLLPTLVSVGASQLPWTRDFLWLVDTPVPGWGDVAVPEAAGVAHRYAKAVELIISTRLSAPSPLSYSIPNVDAAQAVVVSALRKLESVQSGVTGSFRQLLPTLAFGILSMRDAMHGDSKAWTALFRCISDVAIWLAHRSVAAIQSTCGTEDRIQVMEVARSLVHKLSFNPGSIRDLQRRFNHLSASRCQAAVGLLQEAGVVTLDAKTWTLAMPCEEALEKLAAR